MNGENTHISKIQYLAIGEKLNDSQVSNEVIKSSNEFKYLGTYISSEGSTKYSNSETKLNFMVIEN